MGMMTGKNVVIFGVANKRSIAWAIAQAWHREGARSRRGQQPAAGRGGCGATEHKPRKGGGCNGAGCRYY